MKPIMFAGCTASKWTNKQSPMVYGKKESLDCILFWCSTFGNKKTEVCFDS